MFVWALLILLNLRLLAGARPFNCPTAAEPLQQECHSPQKTENSRLRLESWNICIFCLYRSLPDQIILRYAWIRLSKIRLSSASELRICAIFSRKPRVIRCDERGGSDKRRTALYILAGLEISVSKNKRKIWKINIKNCIAAKNAAFHYSRSTGW